MKPDHRVFFEILIGLAPVTFLLLPILTTGGVGLLISIGAILSPGSPSPSLAAAEGYDLATWAWWLALLVPPSVIGLLHLPASFAQRGP